MSALTKSGKPRQRVHPSAGIAERLELHTDRSTGCWIWTASTKYNGYGQMSVGGRLQLVHRVSYEAFVGPIPNGYQIDHLCRVRACCNPHHLEAVTPQANVLRSEAPGAVALRRDLCLYGHPYAEHGVIRCGRRICRLCQNAYMRLYNALPYEEAMRRKMAGEKVVDLGAYFADQRRQAVAA